MGGGRGACGSGIWPRERESLFNKMRLRNKGRESVINVL